MFELPTLYKIVAMILALLIAIIGHEIMHGYVAYKYGDDTAKILGRLSLNPIVHIDLLGSIIIPLSLFLLNAPFLFGWAKPVPVRMDIVIRNGGYFGAFLVSAAGIFYNLFLAIIVAFLIHSFNGGILSSIFGGTFSYFENPNFAFNLLIFILLQILIYNVILAVFNMLPIPPLDGSSMLSYFGLMFKNNFFAKIFAKVNPMFGMLVVMVILGTPLSQIIFQPVNLILKGLLGV